MPGSDKKNCYTQSAKTNQNVEEVFFSIAKDIKQRLANSDSKDTVWKSHEIFFLTIHELEFEVHIDPVILGCSLLQLRLINLTNPAKLVRLLKDLLAAAALKHQDEPGIEGASGRTNRDYNATSLVISY